jgi:AcrR family transcriptional regulator
VVKTQNERSFETRRLINLATIRSLVEAGYASTTTSSVCDRAGVSRGALTHHFASKQEMMTSAITYLSEIQEQELSESARSLADGPQRTRAVIALLWENFRSDLFYASLELWNASRTDPILREALYEAERSLGQRHRALIAELFGKPLTSHPKFSRTMEIIFRQLRGAAVTRILKHDPTEENLIVDDLLAMITAMLAPPSASFPTARPSDERHTDH